MLTAAETDALNSLFEEMLGHISDTGLREAMRHLLMAEGKRLRPALLLHTYKALGGTDTMRCIPAAAALEFTHTWTLIHDDIMDNSDTRRGISTVNKAYGNDAALLAGDGLFTLVTYTLVKTGDEPVKGREILKELMRATLMLIEGQYDDMTLSAREDVGEDSYIRMISKKTG